MSFGGFAALCVAFLLLSHHFSFRFFLWFLWCCKAFLKCSVLFLCLFCWFCLCFFLIGCFFNEFPVFFRDDIVVFNLVWSFAVFLTY